jgi:PHP family Zn ribbon phosphoesterase
MTLNQKIEKSKSKQKKYTLDLRIHSPASLGYISVQGLDTAPALVRLAKVKGIDVIAVTDYHCGAYIDRISAAAKDSDVTVIPGVDLRCKVGICDDVILTVLFPEETTSKIIEEFLLEVGVPASERGNERFLIQKSFEAILEKIAYYKGIAFPSRIDKTPQRMLAIETLVEQYGFRAFDVAYSDSENFFKKKWPNLKFEIFSFSDANALAQVGSRTAEFKLESPTFNSIRELLTDN